MHFKSIFAGACLLNFAVAAIPAHASVSGPAHTIAKRFGMPPKLQDDSGSLILGRSTNAVVRGKAAVKTIDNSDGKGAGKNIHKSYSGNGTPAEGWPSMKDWVSFDFMFEMNMKVMQIGCEFFKVHDDTEQEIKDIYKSIQHIARVSRVDHRFILAVIMQESNGCVRVPTTGNGFRNPGLMQDFQGTHSCNRGPGKIQFPCPFEEIFGMIHDGAVGTASGPGLATDINKSEGDGAVGAQVFYRAARYYNSGTICSPNLSKPCGATASYVSDIANRLTGWLGP